MFLCPKCGSVMIPFSKEGKLYLRCTNDKCGYMIEADEKAKQALRSVGRPDKKAKVRTTGLVAEARRVRPSKEELEQAKEEFYDLVLEQMGDYGE